MHADVPIGRKLARRLFHLWRWLEHDNVANFILVGALRHIGRSFRVEQCSLECSKDSKHDNPVFQPTSKLKLQAACPSHSVVQHWGKIGGSPGHGMFHAGWGRRTWEEMTYSDIQCRYGSTTA